MRDIDEFDLDSRIEPAANWQLTMESETDDTETPPGNPPVSPTGTPTGDV